MKVKFFRTICFLERAHICICKHGTKSKDKQTKTENVSLRVIFRRKKVSNLRCEISPVNLVVFFKCHVRLGSIFNLCMKSSLMKGDGMLLVASAYIKEKQKILMFQLLELRVQYFILQWYLTFWMKSFEKEVILSTSWKS